MSTAASSPSARPGKPLARLGTAIAHGGKLKASGKPVVITMMAFAIMNFMTVVSLRGLPAQAEYGLVSIFYYVFAAVVFLIPTALVAAELASTFPKQGGVFRWVGEAFGPRWGFAAVYWQWQAWVLWLPAVLIFGAAALAYRLVAAELRRGARDQQISMRWPCCWSSSGRSRFSPSAAWSPRSG